jgi:glutaminyl-peptide cyclotransferase
MTRKKPRQTPKRRPAHPYRWAAAILAILLTGAGLALIAGCPGRTDAGPLYTGSVKPQSPFDATRAFRDLEAIVAIGPRPPGSPEALATRQYIKEELEAAGLEVREDAFEASTPVGPRSMANLTAVVEGTQPGIIILGNHYDTKYFPDFPFVGANDGGSTTAWMIELGRTLGPRRDGRTVWLCFFDGEESFKTWTDTDSLYGSREFVRRLKDEGKLDQVRAMINVDMIGDCYLGIYTDVGAPDWLTQTVWAKAQELGYASHFLSNGRSIQDDHIPFRSAGIPALELIDFNYGESFLDHDRLWHTPQDTIDRVCPGSLQVVGDVIYHALPELDARIDELTSTK